jgi:Rrf2 family nitric oxide-sensitive transcriptional repressor
MTQFSNYAIRVLMYSAIKGRTPSAVPEIAKAYGASYNHMKKVAAELCRLGYLETVRGRIGGVRLTKDPAEIRIGDVIRGTEGEVVLVECFDPVTNTCPLIPVCQLKSALHEALAAFFEVLDEYTLDDLIRDSNRIPRLLGLNERAARGLKSGRSRRGAGATVT